MIYVVWALGYGYLLLWAAELAHWHIRARDLLAQIRAQHKRVLEYAQSATLYRHAKIDYSSKGLQSLLRIALRQARKETLYRRRAAKLRYKHNPPTCSSGLAEALRYQDTLTAETR